MINDVVKQLTNETTKIKEESSTELKQLMLELNELKNRDTFKTYKEVFEALSKEHSEFGDLKAFSVSSNDFKINVKYIYFF